jgi:hypothetical protein
MEIWFMLLSSEWYVRQFTDCVISKQLCYGIFYNQIIIIFFAKNKYKTWTFFDIIIFEISNFLCANNNIDINDDFPSLRNKYPIIYYNYCLDEYAINNFTIWNY